MTCVRSVVQWNVSGGPRRKQRDRCLNGFHTMGGCCLGVDVSDLSAHGGISALQMMVQLIQALPPHTGMSCRAMKPVQANALDSVLLGLLGCFG